MSNQTPSQVFNQISDQISKIKTTLITKLQADLVEITDQSDRHKHHKHSPQGSGHYDAVIVSELFADKTLMQQHRLVYAALEQELQTTIHALSLSTFTPQQWSEQRQADG
jgi:BolA family transcriptional regulator, general stress-responsive regulator